MSSWATSRYNWLAGLFLVGGLAGAVALSFLFAKSSPAGWTRRFTVRFSLADGTAGLKPGSAVTLGGQQIGRVTDIRFDSSGADTGPAAVLVDVASRGDLPLYDNAEIVLEKPLLGTLSTLNVISAGNDKAAIVGAGVLLERGDQIKGALAPPAFLAQSGIGGEQVAQIREIINDTQLTMRAAKKLLGDNSENITRSVAKAGTAVDDFATRLPQWSKSLEEILATFSRGAQRVDPILTKVEAGVDEARKVIAETDHAVADIRGLIDRNGKVIDETIANVNTLASGLAGDTLGYVLSTLREAPEIARSLRKVSADAEKISGSLAAELPGIRRIIASSRQAADNAKIGITEVVTQPWRLLYRPTTKELKEQLVYDSARAYAGAVGDLRAISESLQTMSASPETADPEAVKTLVDELKAALTKTKQAESDLEGQLMDVLILSRGGTPPPRPAKPEAPAPQAPAPQAPALLPPPDKSPPK